MRWATIMKHADRDEIMVIQDRDGGGIPELQVRSKEARKNYTLERVELKAQIGMIRTPDNRAWHFPSEARARARSKFTRQEQSEVVS